MAEKKEKKKKLSTDRGCQTAKAGPEGGQIEYAIEGERGLRLRVSANRHGHLTKSWSLLFYRRADDGTRRRFHLGSYPTMGLAEARAEARKKTGEILSGGAQALRKGATKAPPKNTVEAVSRDYIKIYCMQHTRPRTWKERARILGLEPDPNNEGELRFTKSKGEVISVWEGRSIQSISGEDVIDLVDGIAARGTRIAANRTLSVIRGMFAYAISRKQLKASPCAELKPPSKEKKRRRTLKPEELRRVWRAAEQLDKPAKGNYRPRRDAYRMLILSGQRKSQVRLARLEDFDLKQKVWTLPPDGEGSKIEDFVHVLPITAEIEAILQACPHKSGYLFSTTWGTKPLYLGNKLKVRIDALVLEEMHREAAERGDDTAQVKLEPWTNHDLRRTMRTGLSSLAIPEGDLVRELVIGHVQPGVHGIYDCYSYLAGKKVALELWAAKVRSIVEHVQSTGPISN
jgi:integrase